MSHLQSGTLVAAFDIKALVGLRTVKYGLPDPSSALVRWTNILEKGPYLVAANFLRDEIKSLYDTESQLLPLLVSQDSNILDMADLAQVVDARLNGNTSIKPRAPVAPGLTIFSPQ